MNEILRKCLTRDMWNRLKDKKDNSEWSFKHMLHCTKHLQNNNFAAHDRDIDAFQQIGVYLGSHDSFRVFKEFLDVLIKNIHYDFDPSIHTHQHEPENPIVIPKFKEDEISQIDDFRLQVHRNFDGIAHTPAFRSWKERQKVEDIVINAMHTLEENIEGQYYTLEELNKPHLKTELNKLKLLKFYFQNDNRMHKGSNILQDYP